MGIPSVVHLCRPLLATELSNTADLSTAMHVHDFHQFIYLHEGRFTLRLAKGRFAVKAGAFVSLAPGQVHGLDMPPRASLACRLTSVKCWLNPQAGFPEPPEVVDGSSLGDRIETSLRLIIAAFADREHSDQDRIIGGQLMYLLALVGSVSHGRFSDCDPRIRRCTEHILANLDEPLSVRHLAQRCGLNQSYFSRLFHAEIGAAPNLFIRDQRLQRACNLLAFTDGSIAEIAEQVGYRNYHHFSNQFLAVYGKRPSAYRTAMQDPDGHRLYGV